MFLKYCLYQFYGGQKRSLGLILEIQVAIAVEEAEEFGSSASIWVLVARIVCHFLCRSLCLVQNPRESKRTGKNWSSES